MVLIADPVVEQGKSTASTLAQWGLQPALVHDGVEAILAIQRLLPRAIVIDAALPKMFGFQICEIVKRNESLRDIHVVLVGAIHDRTRYRRPPEEIYGADAYIERQDLPGSLQSILQEFGMLSSDRQSTEVSAAATISSAPPVAAPDPTVAPAIPSAPPVAAPDPTVAPAIPSAPPVVAPDPAVAPAIPSAPPVVAPDPAVAPAAPFAPPVVASDPTVAPATPSAPPLVAPAPPVAPVVEETPEAEAPAAPKIVEPAGSTESPVTHQTPESVAPPTPTSGDPETDEKVEQAERLARIVVSDIVLYSKEKFEAAVEAGNVLEAMQPEIAEGRSLFAARVDASIQEMRDFLTEELLRVAEARGKP
jgi:CheY-like chemotaxis protein